MQRSIVDTGPLVALFDKSDYFHKKIYDYFNGKNIILYSTWPVLTEVSFLIDFNKNAQLDFFRWIENGAIQIIDISLSEISSISNYIEKYQNVPMDLADATLMFVSDKLDLINIITLDSDFNIYRNRNGKRLKNLVSKLITN